MDPNCIAEAASLLFAARQKGSRMDRLPAACRPQTVAEAHAIQDAVTTMLGAAVAAYKANAPAKRANPSSPTGTQAASANRPGSEAVRAPIYGPMTRPSPARIAAKDVPQCGVEGEVAFCFRRDLPPRPEPYTRDEIATHNRRLRRDRGGNEPLRRSRQRHIS